MALAMRRTRVAIRALSARCAYRSGEIGADGDGRDRAGEAPAAPASDDDHDQGGVDEQLDREVTRKGALSSA